MAALGPAFKAAGIPALCEMGLDPGIDHMSAVQIIHRIRAQGGTLTAFRSYCGGLVAPESDDNPWHYKFSWNPRNIVTAGQAGAVYKERGRDHSIDYYQLFALAKPVDIAGLGRLAYYPNRDSLAYPPLYGLEDVPTFLRATLRHQPFCDGWDDLIQLGLTDTARQYPTAGHTYASWLKAHETVGLDADLSLEDGVSSALHGAGAGCAPCMHRLKWLGILDDAPLPADLPALASPADVLLSLLLTRWPLRPADRDMVAMQHEICWRPPDGAETKTTSTLLLTGEGGERSAMARTVGLPMGIAARGLTEGRIRLPAGVHIPTMPEVYEPVLKELDDLGIRFAETDAPV